jgi:hypothetical protein
MRKYEIDDHRLEIGTNGVITVYRKEKPALERTTITKDGITVDKIVSGEGDAATEKLLSHFQRTPVFQTCYAGDGWHVDTEAGMSRWIGILSGKCLAQAFRKLGFDAGLVTKLMRSARKTTHQYMGRVCR